MQGNWLYNLLLENSFSVQSAERISIIINVILVVVVLALATLIVKKVLLGISISWIKKNKYNWDDALLNNDLINKLSWFIPIILAHISLDILLPSDSTAYIVFRRMMMVFFILAGVVSINAALSTAGDIYRNLKRRQADVLSGFIDASKIVTYIVGTIFIISILSGMSPWGIISVLGGMTAVTMLVFKDTIVGFVASIQLSTTDMIRIGDWVEMPSYGADGDVIGMSIYTIRVQNWDKTITTIPTWALVSNSFKNWRGMSESGGRRIKRSMLIDINSIRFCDDQLFQTLIRVDLIKEYLHAKHQEILEHNRKIQADSTNDPEINGRRLTNIGIFRAYVIAYLKNNPQISQDMTFLVRQLASTERGLPLEIYVFCKDQRWVEYEAIQADIFDHLLAAMPVFKLRPFQSETDYYMLSPN